MPTTPFALKFPTAFGAGLPHLAEFVTDDNLLFRPFRSVAEGGLAATVWLRGADVAATGANIDSVTNIGQGGATLSPVGAGDRRPQLVANALAGKPAVRLRATPEGSESYALSTGDVPAGRYLYAAVIRYDGGEGGAGYNGTYMTLDGTSGNAAGGLIEDGAGAARHDEPRANTLQLYADGAARPLVDGYVKAWDVPRLVGNAVLVTFVTDGDVGGAGRKVWMGRNANHPTAFFMDATWFEGGIVPLPAGDTSGDAAKRQKVEGYLAHQWGLQALLPPTHPFRTTPPYTG